MSTVPCNCDHSQADCAPVIPTADAGRQLHRLAQVQREQGISDRTMASRLGVSIEKLRRMQVPGYDMSLSELYKWQAALDVPIADLVMEPTHALSPSVARRARLVKVMKTVRSLQRANDTGAVPILVEQLAEQLVELMPELIHVDSWPIVGKRRHSDDVSPIEERMLPESILDGKWAPELD